MLSEDTGDRLGAVLRPASQARSVRMTRHECSPRFDDSRFRARDSPVCWGFVVKVFEASMPPGIKLWVT
ncbi:hypothetical protein GCM10012285_44130 [Streptomyces kronopolitis]|uniref:Uncharacterized protein n=1 Tax=Streptomyces kronopolitis TaxID=1612435 RepID=A0ABQ2JQC1_9ACTN|nr:hypothetical protein GCM10012285_44130 [Streptomyces kronopolitis]